MFYIALLLLILLGLIALAVVGLNIGALLNGVSLNLLVWHPSIPVLLLCLFGACLGGLLLYVVSIYTARRDAQELKRLRTYIEELGEVKAPSSGSPPSNFVPPAVPMPGLPSTGPLPPGQPQSGPLPPKEPPASGSLSNLPPSSSGISSLSLPARQASPPQAPPSSGLRPPFFSQ